MGLFACKIRVLFFYVMIGYLWTDAKACYIKCEHKIKSEAVKQVCQ